jgi:phage internal scaffolding protein
MKTSIRKPYDPRDRQHSKHKNDGNTKQEFLEETDINNIMLKYQKTGAITHANNHLPEYGFATGQDFRDSMELVTKGRELFEDLPSSIRSRFGNSPEAFLDFAQNPDNAPQMASMGLLETKQASTPEKPERPPEAPQKPLKEAE